MSPVEGLWVEWRVSQEGGERTPFYSLLLLLLELLLHNTAPVSSRLVREIIIEEALFHKRYVQRKKLTNM